jgi:hypothetical protein
MFCESGGRSQQPWARCFFSLEIATKENVIENAMMIKMMMATMMVMVSVLVNHYY